LLVKPPITNPFFVTKKSCKRQPYQRGTPTTGTPALISPVGADAKVLLQKYSAVAADCVLAS